jgi:hypothetical protein
VATMPMAPTAERCTIMALPPFPRVGVLAAFDDKSWAGWSQSGRGHQVSLP